MGNGAMRGKDMLRFVVSVGLYLMLLPGGVVAQQGQTKNISSASANSKVVVHHRHVAKRHHRKKATPAPMRVDVYNGSTTQTQVFNDQPVSRSKKNGKAAPAVTRVDVINGSVKQMQVFNAEPIGGANSKTKHKHSQRNVAQANFSDVEIFNGTTKQRRVFRQEQTPAREPAAPARPNNAPVVVGIAATGTEARAENASSDVVTSVESGRPVATPTPVAVGISPAPAKRPAYVPAPEQ